ncbi:MAG: hypothetical protein ACREV7_14485 [Steroidobacteraceae bacterium]
MQPHRAKSVTYPLIFAMAGLGAQAYAVAQSPAPPDLNCRLGPLQRTFAKVPWHVYGCDDRHSMVIVTAPGNPAMPFYFLFVWTGHGYVLHGEGTGNKAVTDSALSELKAFSEADITRLYAQAVAGAKPDAAR